MAAPAMTEKRRLILSIAVVAGGALLLAGGWYLGIRKEREIAAALKETQQKAEQLQKRLDRREDLRRQSRDRAALEQRLVMRLPDTPELGRVYALLQDVERQAGSAGGRIDFSITLGKAVEAKDSKKKGPAPAAVGFEETVLEVEAAGSWAGFVSFLDGLEHADRLIAVRGFKTSTDSDKSGGPGRGYRILLSVFSLKAPEKKAPPAAPKPS